MFVSHLLLISQNSVIFCNSISNGILVGVNLFGGRVVKTPPIPFQNKVEPYFIYIEIIVVNQS